MLILLCEFKRAEEKRQGIPGVEHHNEEEAERVTQLKQSVWKK
jgi:hypothetical protein